MKSICVIDDDDIYQRIIRKLIIRSEAFKDAIYYKSGISALKQLQDPTVRLPEIILLDINMPEMDGWQFIEEIKKVRPDIFSHTQIYIVTSSIAISDKEKITEYPELAGFYSKPMKLESLKEIGG